MLARLAPARDHSLNDTELMQYLTLYSTSHCSLCDQALELLFSMPGLAGVQLEVIDVADDDSLLERYGEKIPVLRMGESELPAPFGSEELARFLRG
jgi:glutaredoxin